MEKTNYITATQFCNHYGVELSFITQLQQFGLVEIVDDEEPLIPLEGLSELEKYARLHYDLDINTEGIEAINYLLERMGDMQNEIAELKARLRLYEGE